MEDKIFEPAEEYRAHFKGDFKKRANDVFDEYTKKSKLDVSENKRLCDEFYALQNDVKGLKKKIGLFTFLFVSLIVLSVLALLLAFYFISEQNYVLGVIMLILIPALLLIDFLVVSKKRKKLTEIKIETENKANEKKTKATELMAPFFAEFDRRLPSEMLTGVNPIIKTYPCFSSKFEKLMNEEYNFSTEREENVSTIFALFGFVNGSPFLLEKNKVMTMRPKQYTGTLTIHWTTTSRDSKGNIITHHHTQTLIAHALHDAPDYSDETHLSYGNPAAPDLNFTRTPTEINPSDEGEMKKLIKKTEKKLKELQEDALKEGKNFTPMANTEFEGLFGAYDRDNEVQFRLLFTPLAITNFFELLKDKESFGDDFSFRKRGKMNYVISTHSQIIDYSGDIYNYLSFDYEKMKKQFFEYTEKYFKGLFFDLAPLLSIPIYQMTKPQKTEEDFEVKKCYSDIEAEIMANQLKSAVFQHALTKTDSILKAELVSSDSKSDTYTITAHSFRTEPRCDYIPTLGGDGRMHPVPVPWLEYFAVSKDTEFVLTKDELNGDYTDITSARQRGINAFIKK